jgi:type I restriction enzyme S subunit
MRLHKQWSHVQLSSICKKIGSGSTPRGGDGVYLDEGTAIIRSQNVYNGRFSADGLAHITEIDAEKLSGVTVELRDVLLNITGDSVARCCHVPEWVLPARVNQHVAIVRPDVGQLLPEFLCYYFISPLMQKYLLSRAGSGGTRNALTKGMIEAFEVPCPSLATQQRIVELLKSYDDLIENNRRRIQLLEQAARLLYKEWFVHLRFPGHEHVKIKDGVPEGWEKKTIGELAPLKYGKALKQDDRIPGPYPVYGSSGVIGIHDKALVAGPAILVGRKGNVGSVYYSKSDFYPIDTVYYIETENCSLYLYYALLHTQFISTDVAVPGLNRDYAHSRTMLVPDDKILTLFEQHAVTMHDQIDCLTKYNESLSKVRDLLLPRLMNGEIAV